MYLQPDAIGYLYFFSIVSRKKLMNEKHIFFFCVIFGFVYLQLNAFYICILLVLFLVIKVNSHKLWFFIFRSSDTYFQRTFYVNQHLYTHFFYAWKNERIWSKCTWAKIPINTAKCKEMEHLFYCCSSSWSHHEARKTGQ